MKAPWRKRPSRLENLLTIGRLDNDTNQVQRGGTRFARVATRSGKVAHLMHPTKGVLCPECHRKAEARDWRMGMNWGGFWIRHGTTPAYDPRNVPVMLASPHGSGMTVYLAVDGKGPDGTGYMTQPPEGAVAA